MDHSNEHTSIAGTAHGVIRFLTRRINGVLGGVGLRNQSVFLQLGKDNNISCKLA